MLRNHPGTLQGGHSLIEALIASTVLSLSLLAMACLQSSMRQNADLARQRSEALQWAQQTLEGLRTRTALTPGAGAPVERLGANTSYRLSSAVTDGSQSGLRSANVHVTWVDRGGATRAIVLDSGLATASPVYSAWLARPPQDRSVAAMKQLPWGTHPMIDGRSVFKPTLSGTQAWLFNSSTGEITALCSGLTAGRSASEIRASELTHCEAIQGALLSGYLRFSIGGTPDAQQANDPPLPLKLALTLDPALPVQPRCDSEARTADPGVHFVAYTCVVTLPNSFSTWSGRLDVLPEGWAIGTGVRDYKVCRYSVDRDGSGRVDRNDEHPARYLEVAGPLVQQNYLVIRGDQACPAPLPPHNDASAATVQHQP